jgi:hypothetical protein
MGCSPTLVAMPTGVSVWHDLFLFACLFRCQPHPNRGWTFYLCFRRWWWHCDAMQAPMGFAADVRNAINQGAGLPQE